MENTIQTPLQQAEEIIRDAFTKGPPAISSVVLQQHDLDDVFLVILSKSEQRRNAGYRLDADSDHEFSLTHIATHRTITFKAQGNGKN